MFSQCPFTTGRGITFTLSTPCFEPLNFGPRTWSVNWPCITLRVIIGFLSVGQVVSPSNVAFAWQSCVSVYCFLPPQPPSMGSCATFCNVPLSTSVNPVSERSLISLDWVLTAGIPAPQSVASGILTLPSGNTVCSMHMKLSVTAGLTDDLVLGCDWLFFFCRQTLPHASFHLSSGIVHPGRQPSGLSTSL
jgi:hypothetical protein